MDPEELLDHIRMTARSMGIADVGVASASAWIDVPEVRNIIREGCRPSDILPDAESVIILR